MIIFSISLLFLALILVFTIAEEESMQYKMTIKEAEKSDSVITALLVIAAIAVVIAAHFL